MPDNKFFSSLYLPLIVILVALGIFAIGFNGGKIRSEFANVKPGDIIENKVGGKFVVTEEPNCFYIRAQNEFGQNVTLNYDSLRTPK